MLLAKQNQLRNMQQQPTTATLKWNGIEKPIQIVGKGTKGYAILLDGKRVWVSDIFLSDFKS